MLRLSVACQVVSLWFPQHEQESYYILVWEFLPIQQLGCRLRLVIPVVDKHRSTDSLEYMVRFLNEM